MHSIIFSAAKPCWMESMYVLDALMSVDHGVLAAGCVGS
jgi:hypothetical protein